MRLLPTILDLAAACVRRLSTILDAVGALVLTAGVYLAGGAAAALITAGVLLLVAAVAAERVPRKPASPRRRSRPAPRRLALAPDEPLTNPELDQDLVPRIAD